MTFSPFHNFTKRLLACSGSVLLAVGLTLSASAAQAQDKNSRAIQNAMRLTAFLDAVPKEQQGTILEKIESGDIPRYAPEQPVWIIDTESGSLLYYQGQSTFKGQAAAQLVDDAGVRFGQKALENGRASKSGWVRIILGGSGYSAYCHSKYPTIVCSLIP